MVRRHRYRLLVVTSILACIEVAGPEQAQPVDDESTNDQPQAFEEQLVERLESTNLGDRSRSRWGLFAS